MKLTREMLILYAVTDRSWLLPGQSLGSCVEQAILGGATMVQLREKNLDPTAFYEEAVDIQKICKKHQIPFLLNDNVELAARIDADGVHVGQNDMSVREARNLLGPDKIIGATAKTIPQATAAALSGADYIGSGAVFGTTTKMDAKPMELSLLKEITHSVSIPVVAIGGITSENIGRLKNTGIAGVAVVSGIFAQPEIEVASRQLYKQLTSIL